MPGHSFSDSFQCTDRTTDTVHGQCTQSARGPKGDGEQEPFKSPAPSPARHRVQTELCHVCPCSACTPRKACVGATMRRYFSTRAQCPVATTRTPRAPHSRVSHQRSSRGQYVLQLHVPPLAYNPIQMPVVLLDGFAPHLLLHHVNPPTIEIRALALRSNAH